MSRINLNPTIIFTILSLISMNTLSLKQFEGKAMDDVLLAHYNHLTRFEHSFEHLPKGDCGKIFDIAEEQYNLHMKSKFTLALVDKMLENSSFDRTQCKHVSGAYTWVLLVAEEDNVTCEVHMPLDLRNYEKDDREKHPLLRVDYAEKAILEKNSWCYHIDAETQEKREVVYFPKVEAFYQEAPVITREIHEESYPKIDAYYQEAPVYTIHKTVHSSDLDQNEEDQTQMKKFNMKINIDDENNSNTDLNDDIGEQLSTHQEQKEGITAFMNECTHEDKLKILDLYAANIVGSHEVGFQIYTENVINCRAGHDEVDTYAAEIILDDHLCDFHVVHDAKNVDLKFMPTRSENVLSCQDFKGF